MVNILKRQAEAELGQAQVVARVVFYFKYIDYLFRKSNGNIFLDLFSIC